MIFRVPLLSVSGESGESLGRDPRCAALGLYAGIPRTLNAVRVLREVEADAAARSD